MRLNKYVALSGLCSRRKADEHIKNGEVKVNGKTVLEMGHKVDRQDKITFNGKLLSPQKKAYILLNKTKNVITTTFDPQGRKTVMDMVRGARIDGLYPVGRLDRNTTGLLLLTNDGELAQQLAHPSFEVKKLYNVELDKPLTKLDFERILQKGVRLEEGIAKVDDLAYVKGETKKCVGIQIHIGWNRVVRRIFEKLGYTVKKLDRVMYAQLTKKDLPRSRWRNLTEQEIITLKHRNRK